MLINSSSSYMLITHIITISMMSRMLLITSWRVSIQLPQRKYMRILFLGWILLPSCTIGSKLAHQQQVFSLLELTMLSLLTFRVKELILLRIWINLLGQDHQSRWCTRKFLQLLKLPSRCIMILIMMLYSKFNGLLRV